MPTLDDVNEIIEDPSIGSNHPAATLVNDWVGADASFQRAISLEPGNPENVRLAASSAARLEKAVDVTILTGIRSGLEGKLI